MDSLRNNMLADAEEAARRQRFGLFNHPPPLYLGDDSGYLPTTHGRDDQGKPVLHAKNMRVPTSKGKHIGDLFSFTANSEVSQKYMDPSKTDRVLSLRLYKAMSKHDSKFKPANNYRALVNGPYQHIDANDPLLDPRRKRNSEGKVLVHPKNCTTNPHSKVTRQTFKDYELMNEPYEGWKEQNKRALLQHRAKMRQPFKQSTGKSLSFSTDREIYGQEGIPAKQPRASTLRTNHFKHDRRFRCSGPMKEFIGSFPEYMYDPLREVKPVKDSQKKDHFKGMVVPKSRPTPSVTLNLRNIRSH